MPDPGEQLGTEDLEVVGFEVALPPARDDARNRRPPFIAGVQQRA
jgi:hypothetical protein